MTVRALTVRQPWASCIVHGGKRVENRTWTPPAAGWVLIHAGGSEPHHIRHLPHVRSVLDQGVPVENGAIIGVARITGWHTGRGCCQPWGADGQYHWDLADVTALTRVVRCRGWLRLWTPDPAVLAAVSGQVTLPGVAA